MVRKVRISGQFCVYFQFLLLFDKSRSIFDHVCHSLINSRSIFVSRLSWLCGLKILAPLSHRSERHPLATLVAFGTDKPKCQPTCVVVGGRSILVGPNTQRSFSASFAPTTGLHDHTHHHANGLPQSFASLSVNLRKSPIDRWM